MSTKQNQSRGVAPAASHTPGPVQAMRNETMFLDALADRRHGLLFSELGEVDQQYVLAEYRLIAAAQELLEALRRAEMQLKVLAKYHEDAWHADEKAEVEGTVAEARVAIAKATGGAS